MKKKIVIIDDEADILQFLSFNLKKEGFTVETFTSPLVALEYIKKSCADLVITDWIMPELEGLDVCRSLKMDPKYAAIPIFMISCKNDEIDVVTALELGVEDYLSKPFRVKEMISRVKKILHREANVQQTSKHIIIRDELKIDPENYTVYVNEKELLLTNCEFNLLHLLASKPGKVFSRYDIIESFNTKNNRDDNILVTPRSVDVQVVGLRKKLGEYKDYVETIRSVGYKFNVPA